ncbi:MAG: HTTM domain-containing protein, partial [Myxococcota bacterium]
MSENGQKRGSAQGPGRSAWPAWLVRYQQWWLSMALPRAQLLAFRVAFFAAIAVDRYLLLSHTPRYGAGDFNVSHLPWLDSALPEPTRPVVLVMVLVQCYLAVLIAGGAATRPLLGLLAGLCGYSYFISQLDSYQHHYLVFLLLVIACFVPWPSRAHPDAAANSQLSEGRSAPDEVVHSWAMRLFAVQIAVVYLWAAVTKLADPLWLDGTTLGQQLGGAAAAERGVAGAVIAAVGIATASWLTALAELFLAAGWLIRRLRLPALLIGVPFHIGIELTGFEIGVFSYLMLAIYLLLVPGSAFIWAGRQLGRLRSGDRGGDRGAGPAQRRTVVLAVAVIAALGGTALLLALPFAERVVVAGLVAVIGVLAVLRARQARPTLAAAHVVACAVTLLLAIAGTQTHDYYKYWGGTSR